MWNKILLVLVGALLTIAVIMFVNTMQLSHHQIEPGEMQPVMIDQDAMVSRFSAAIKFKTISFENPADRDTVEFAAFLDFIEREYPLVHERLERQLFNRYTPLYFWEGSNPALEPVLLMGHYDVVPIDSTDIDGWDFEPFSGEVSDGFIYGRGTLDNKITVMALLETAEYLLAEGYEPARSIYFSFGHDEEIGGNEGARMVSRYLEDNGIKLDFVLDEGGVVLTDNPFSNKPVAMVGVAEKGYLSLELIVRTQGGHSSQPPDEMAIAILSEAVAKLSKQKFPTRLDGATEKMFDSMASKMPFATRMAYANRWLLDGFIRRNMASEPRSAAMIQTTIAPTMIRAGVKDNVLPNEARAVVNFRLLPGDSFDDVENFVRNAIGDERVQIRKYETIQTSPSPVSSVSSDSYLQIQQSIMNRFGDIYVAPYLVLGATDSRYFSNVTDQIYRFMPVQFEADGLARIHGTNERIDVASYAGSVGFYSDLIKRVTE
jgi:carboxypeptidase PM20D1